MAEGHEVIVVDNMFTGRKKNVAHWIGHPHFMLIVHDVVEPILLEVDQIYHLACPASPPHYQYNPIKTIKTSTMGTLNMLGLAKRVRARMLLTSTSEVYGDPQIHPQPESYWGNVNPIGPRACYDEGKRVAETMMYAYRSQGGEGDSSMEVRVARIFNTFGPRMHPNDGRVVRYGGRPGRRWEGRRWRGSSGEGGRQTVSSILPEMGWSCLTSCRSCP
jgi:UDP-glucuronate decarboxylase